MTLQVSGLYFPHCRLIDVHPKVSQLKGSETREDMLAVTPTTQFLTWGIFPQQTQGRVVTSVIRGQHGRTMVRAVDVAEDFPC